MKGEYIWIVFLFLVGGCSSKSTGDIMDLSVNIESEGRMSEYFQEAELFFLETNDQALISNVDQVVLADNRIVLLGNFARTYSPGPFPEASIVAICFPEVLKIKTFRAKLPNRTIRLSAKTT